MVSPFSSIFSGRINIAAVTSRDGSKSLAVRTSSDRKAVLASETGVSFATDHKMTLAQLRSRSIISVS